MFPSGQAFLVDNQTLTSLDVMMGDITQTAIVTWDLQTGRRLRRTSGPSIGIRKSAFSADGTTLVILGFDQRVKKAALVVWDVVAGKERTPPTLDGDSASTIALAADGKTLALAATGKPGSAISLWDLETQQAIGELNADVAVHLLAFSPDGSVLLSTGTKGKISLWQVGTGKQLWAEEGKGPSFSAVAFSPDGKQVASTAEEDQTTRLRDAATGRQLRAWKGDFGLASLAFSPDGKYLASGADYDSKWPGHRPVQLWDVATGTEIRRFKGHLFGVNCIAFSKDGSKLVSGGVVTAPRIYEVASGVELFQPEAHESFVSSVAFSPQGKSVATGGFDGSVRLWDATTGKPLRLLLEAHQGLIGNVFFSPDGRSLAASAKGDNQLKIWEPGSGRITARLAIKKAPVAGAYAPDGRTLVTASGNVERAEQAFQFWETRTYKELPPPVKATGIIGTHSFSDDSRWMATMTQPGGPNRDQPHVSVWDLVARKETRKWPMPSGMTVPALAPNGSLLAVAELVSKRLHLMDVANGKDHYFSLRAESRPSSLAFSPDGRVLAIGTGDGVIVLWEVAAGQVRRRLRGHLSMVGALSFSTDGKLLVSGSQDSTALVWDISGLPGNSVSPPAPLSRGRLQTLWDKLAGEDAAGAYQAILALQSSPAHSLPFLKEKLRPLAAADPQRLAQLIAQLDSRQFAARQDAMRELQQLGERAESELTRALQRQPSLEARQRIEELLDKLNTPVAAPELLRSLRAVEALEQMALPGAKQILQSLATGKPDSRLTKAAVAALARMPK
jgi:WD40 repeat protein